MTTQESLFTLLAVRDLFVRYCRMIDRGQPHLVGQVFHPDAVINRASGALPAGAALAEIFQRFDAIPGHNMSHNITNLTLRQSGDQVRAEAYFTAWMPVRRADAAVLRTKVAGRYLNKAERRDGVWKFTSQQIVVDFAETEDGSPWAGAAQYPAGGRREADPGAAFFADLADQPNATGETKMTLDEALDQMAIREVLVRYCRGIDRGDKALVRSAYHPDATDDHGTFNGRAHDFPDVVVPRMDAVGRIGQHNVTNVQIEVEGDRAKGESYFVTYNPEAQADGSLPRIMLVLGRYLDVFEKRGGDWKILDRRVVIDYAEPLPDGTPWPRLADFTLGGRREADPAHGFLKN